MKKIQYDKYFVGDFETTVYDGQDETAVWASAIVELYTENVKIFHSIFETFDYLFNSDHNTIIYYHNLKFDGTFIITELIKQNFKQSFTRYDTDNFDGEWISDNLMLNHTFKYVISDRGQWYTITVKEKGRYYQFRDSLKLLPLSVKSLGESFGTKHHKLDMEYKGFRYPGCTITDEEKKYIANDVLVVKEAIEIMFDQGHNRLTIGSCCLEEFMKTYDKIDYKTLFPDLTEIQIDKKYFEGNNPNIKMPDKLWYTIDSYVRRSYRGGWCYVVENKKCKIYENGITLDVNSLYPSMMHSISGNYYPVGKPMFWSGDYIPDFPNGHIYYFIRVKTRFKLKPGYLPFIQIKNSIWYKGTEMLKTSDVYDEKTGEYMKGYFLNGVKHEFRPILTLTCTDWELFKTHYYIYDTEILDGCYFRAEIGIFDKYIDKYKLIKETSKGAKRLIAKLFLNNLYGKEASSKDSSFKYAYLGDNGELKFKTALKFEKKAGYIPIGSAITSYARNFTITAAQANYHGDDEKGFIYADTDSLHLDIDVNDAIGVELHETEFCKWKHENTWKYGFFTRQKTYIEVTEGDDGNLEYDIKCAGMPDRAKQNFIEQIKNGEKTISDFVPGLEVEGKLQATRIKGGTLLKETTYKMKRGN